MIQDTAAVNAQCSEPVWLSRLGNTAPAVLIELAVVALPGLLLTHSLRSSVAIPYCQVASYLPQQEPVVWCLGHICEHLLGALVDVADLQRIM